MAIVTHAKLHFKQLTVSLIFAIRASEPPPPRARRAIEKAGPERVKSGVTILSIATVIITPTVDPLGRHYTKHGTGSGVFCLFYVLTKGLFLKTDSALV